MCFQVLHQVFCLGGIDMRKYKIKLRVQPIYSIVIYFILGLISLFFVFMPMLLSWKESSWLIEFVWHFAMTLFIVYGFAQGILHIQWAEVDKEKMIIKNLFCVIAVLKWSEINRVKKEKILTYDSRGYICLDWLVIRTHETQKQPYRAKYKHKRQTTNQYPCRSNRIRFRPAPNKLNQRRDNHKRGY